MELGEPVTCRRLGRQASLLLGREVGRPTLERASDSVQVSKSRAVVGVFGCRRARFSSLDSLGRFRGTWEAPHPPALEASGLATHAQVPLRPPPGPFPDAGRAQVLLHILRRPGTVPEELAQDRGGLVPLV